MPIHAGHSHTLYVISVVCVWLCPSHILFTLLVLFMWLCPAHILFTLFVLFVCGCVQHISYLRYLCCLCMVVCGGHNQTQTTQITSVRYVLDTTTHKQHK
jgi:hypothetical protein